MTLSFECVPRRYTPVGEGSGSRWRNYTASGRWLRYVGQFHARTRRRHHGRHGIAPRLVVGCLLVRESGCRVAVDLNQDEPGGIIELLQNVETRDSRLPEAGLRVRKSPVGTTQQMKMSCATFKATTENPPMAPFAKGGGPKDRGIFASNRYFHKRSRRTRRFRRIKSPNFGLFVLL